MVGWFYRLAIALLQLQLANVCGRLGVATSMRAPAAAAAARDSVRQQPEWHRRRAQAPRRPVVVNLCLSAAGCANVLTDSQKHLNIAGSQRSAGGLLLPG